MLKKYCLFLPKACSRNLEQTQAICECFVNREMFQGSVLFNGLTLQHCFMYRQCYGTKLNKIIAEQFICDVICYHGNKREIKKCLYLVFKLENEPGPANLIKLTAK